MKQLDSQSIITSSGAYPERAQSPELTVEVKANINDLVKRVNNLLQAVYKSDVKVSSGFRPSSVNANIANAAKKSLHLQGKAVDIYDPNGKFKEIILKHLDEKANTGDDVLTLYGLWLENPEFTKSWLHFDTGTRSARKRRVFNP